MKALVTISFVFLSFVCAAQSNIKLYAFKQAFVPGLPKSKDTIEHERSSQKKDASTNYLIYLTYPTKGTISGIELWINGEPFELTQQKITTTPIEYIYDENSFQPQKMILVPADQGHIFQLKPIGKLLSKVSLTNKSQSKTNELVVVYKEKGKPNWILMKKVKSLPPKFRQ